MPLLHINMLPGPGRRNTDHGVCMIGSADENRIDILVPDDFPVIMVDRYSVERFPILFGIIIMTSAFPSVALRVSRSQTAMTCA